MEHKKKVIALAILGVSTVVVIVWNVMLAKGPTAVELPAPDLTHDRLLRLTAEVTAFVTKEGRPPSSLEELGAKADLLDGWKQAFAFKSNAQGKRIECEVRSLGADGQNGNDDDQASILKFGPDPYGGVMLISGTIVPVEPR